MGVCIVIYRDMDVRVGLEYKLCSYVFKTQVYYVLCISWKYISLFHPMSPVSLISLLKRFFFLMQIINKTQNRDRELDFALCRHHSPFTVYCFKGFFVSGVKWSNQVSYIEQTQHPPWARFLNIPSVCYV